MAVEDETFLDQLLRKATGGSESHIVPSEYSRLVTLFAPSKLLSTSGKAHLALAFICERHRKSKSGSSNESYWGTHDILHLFSSTLDAKLTEVEEQPILEALSFTAALFAVDWQSAASLFTRDGFQDTMMDALDLFPNSPTLPHVVASLLSMACGYKICTASLSPRCSSWLDTIFRTTQDEKLKSSSSLALLKLTQSADINESDIGGAEGSEPSSVNRQQNYFLSLRDIIVHSTSDLKDIADSIEGLAYLSTRPFFKEAIAGDKALLHKLVSFQKVLHPKVQFKDTLGTAPYGLAAVIANLTYYRPQLTEEQSQIERLRHMAQPGASKNIHGDVSGVSEGILDDDEHVRQRSKRLTEAGSADLLVALSKTSESPATRMTIGKAFLGLVEDKGNRGKVLQAGGAKALMSLIRSSQQKPDPSPTNTLAKANTEFADLVSIQALAKLSITSSPIQVFGPDENAIIEAIKPFACLLLHNASTLLQKFEALMALTNISSSGPEMADRVAQTEGLLSKIEFMLLDDNELVRRASTELLCNLVSGSELAFIRFSGEGASRSSGPSNQAKARLHILIALADVDDEPTRLAASGALAILTGSPAACRSIIQLELENHRVFPLFRQLIDPGTDVGEPVVNVNANPGLVHRGVVCFRNVVLNGTEEFAKDVVEEVVKHGIARSLVKIVRSSGQNQTPEAVLRPVTEVLKWLMDSGVDIMQ